MLHPSLRRSHTAANNEGMIGKNGSGFQFVAVEKGHELVCLLSTRIKWFFSYNGDGLIYRCQSCHPTTFSLIYARLAR